MHGSDHRRGGPDPIPFPGDVPWATGTGNVSGSTIGNDTTPVFPDIEAMATNRPDIFNLAETNEPTIWGSSYSSTCIGLHILEPSFYRIWAGHTYESSGSTLTGPNFSGQAYSNWIFTWAFIDFTEARGFNRVSFFGAPSSTATLMHMSYSVDFAYYPGLPIVGSDALYDTIIPFGMVQNTTHGGAYQIDFLIYQLESGPIPDGGDFADVTYLPPS